ncbi:DNA-binding protein [bacterium]|nr:MAG: DNA-binding protein [bacterium]
MSESGSNYELVTVGEARSQLSISRTLIYSLMERGELPYVKIGRARRIAQDAIRRFIQKNTKGPRS